MATATRTATCRASGRPVPCRPEREAAGQLDAVPERREPGERLRTSGRLSMGKKVPDSRNNGVIPNRKMARSCPVSAGWPRTQRSGPRTPSPSERRPGWRARTMRPRPNRTTTSVNDRHNVSRAAIQTRLPRATSRGPIGVATIAWKTLFQASPSMIGYVASKAADCIAVAAEQAGRQEREVGRPRRGCRCRTRRRSGPARSPSPPGTSPARRTSRRAGPKRAPVLEARCSKTRDATWTVARRAAVIRPASGRSAAGRRPRAAPPDQDGLGLAGRAGGPRRRPPSPSSA